ncbi:hypothetical protein ACHAWO_010759 [Cyclotella atomus]|uniref:Spindle pole body component n=1 Tax=Cyclotella atomus TaxID=382360 RepID=A0ABD3NH44_9STRA
MTSHTANAPVQKSEQSNSQAAAILSAHLSREKALLRELIILTLRHADGDFIRFVPTEHDNETVLYPNRIVENEHSGVRINPSIGLLSLPPTNNEEEYNQDLQFKASYSSILSSGCRDAISIASQCGILYSHIVTFCESIEHGNVSACSVTQALAVRMHEEMEWYHGVLAGLESELNPRSNVTNDTGRNEEKTNGMTLRRLLTRLPPILSKLRTLSVMSSVGMRNLRGGKLLSSILSHVNNGSSEHAALVSSIAADISVPWYSMLNDWLSYGILKDVHHEFFVVEMEETVNETDRGKTSMGYYSWHERFGLLEGRIPMQIMNEELARGILDVGKGINFVRGCLHDGDWEIGEEIECRGDSSIETGAVDEETKPKLKYGFVTLSDLKPHQDESLCISTLHEVVTKSSNKIHRHILDSLLNKHQLVLHLHALKRFLFLGQGDFVSSLVESLHLEFRGRTSLAGIYSHTLSGVLEGALRTSNARYLPDVVLNRLMPKLMVDESDADRYWMGPPPTSTNEEEGELIPWEDREDVIQDPWDYVCLEYVIDSPLDAIVHTEALDSYHRVFMFLFRLKRVEWMLNHSWRQSTELNHAILIETKAGGCDAPHIGAAAEQSSFLLRRISSIRQTMLHFVSNLQNYLMFEVLEGGWEGLVQSVNSSQSLDGVIAAHDLYLNEILVKTLLSNHVGDGQENGKGKSLEDLLRRLLSLALKFGKFQDFIFGNALAALNKSAWTRRRVAEMSRSGTWGRRDIDEEEGQVFIYLADAQLFQFVEKTAKDFDKVLGALLKMLKKEVFDDAGDDKDDSQPLLNHDALRFLLFRLDYSGYYHRQAKARSKRANASS